MVSFKRCCFFVDLKIAGIVIGILQIAGSIYIIKHQMEALENMEKGSSDYYQKWANLIMITLLAFCSLIMIYGAIRRNKNFVTPWLLCTTVYGVCIALGLLFKSYRILLPELVVNFAEIVVLFYVWVCIYSMYKMFRTEKWERDELAKPKTVEVVEVTTTGSRPYDGTTV